MESRNPFDEQMVMKTVQNEVEKHFNTETNFNSLKAMQLCETLTNDIIDIIFDMKFERYLDFNLTKQTTKSKQINELIFFTL